MFRPQCRANGRESIHAQTMIPFLLREHTVTRASMPKPRAVRVPSAYGDQSIRPNHKSVRVPKRYKLPMEQDFGRPWHASADIFKFLFFPCCSSFFHHNSMKTIEISTFLNVRVPFQIPPLVTKPSPETWNLLEPQAKPVQKPQSTSFFFLMCACDLFGGLGYVEAISFPGPIRIFQHQGCECT